MIYVAVDSPNLGFPNFNFFRGVPVKKTPCSIDDDDVDDDVYVNYDAVIMPIDFKYHKI